MEVTDFIKETEDYVYKEVAKYSNLLLGKNKTASLSTGLFLKLPMEITVERSHAPLPPLRKELKSFLNYFSAYTKMGDSTKVYFTFMYHTEKDLKAIQQHLSRHKVFFAFVYIHEVQHIIRKHITKSYNTMMLNIAGNVSNAHELINIAEDHAINYSIKDLFSISKSSELSHAWPTIEETGYYNGQYHTNQLSDIDILKLLLEEDECVTKQQISDMMSQITCDGKSSIQLTDPSTGDGQEESEGNGKPDKCDTTSDDLDNSIADLSESLQDIIASNTKGTAVGELFEKMFDSIKVETGWFKKIKASFKRRVFYMTHDFNTSWSNLNNTYRRIYKAPKKIFMDDKVEIILSIDQSGSMPQDALQRLLYLMESESTRITSITVLIHDMRVTKVFEIQDEYDIAKSPEFIQALATRYSSGGTSHACVFEHIQEMKLKDPTKVIFLSYSDNYSDIDQCFSKYSVMRKLTNYWVCPIHNPVRSQGVNITMV